MRTTPSYGKPKRGKLFDLSSYSESGVPIAVPMSPKHARIWMHVCLALGLLYLLLGYLFCGK